MAGFDRKRIVDLMRPHYPLIAEMTGAEIQDFLNKESGVLVTDEMPNGVAFDMWRQALAKTGKPDLWPYNAGYMSKIQERTQKMLEEESERLK